MENKQEVKMIEGERAYPIWSINIHWIQDAPKDYKPSKIDVAELPMGRIYNATGCSKMWKDEVTAEQVDAYAREWSDKVLANEKYKNANVSNIQIKTEFVRYEVWCLGWFSHYTFDIGQTDEEALRSFSGFVSRMECLNERERTFKDGFWHEPYCLMGAEDEWRWHGRSIAGNDDRTNPPCRCDGCKRAGIIRIDH